MRYARWLMLSLAFAAVTTALAAQDEPQRKGLYFGFGLGYSSLGASGDIDDVSREWGLSGQLKVGVAATPRVSIGLETDGFYKKIGGDPLTAGGLFGNVIGYLSKDAPLFVKLGAGLFTYKEEDSSLGYVIDATSTGFAVQGGLGYDFHFSPTFALTAYAQYIRSLSGEAKISGESTGLSFKPNMLQFGLGLTWH